MGNHRSFQRCGRCDCVRLPDGLPPERAVFARLMGVSMTTLITTRARPGDLVLVTGLGIVGNLAAQMFAACGYETVGVEPNRARRELALSAGLGRVEERVPLEDASVAGRVALAVECSGHEQAVLEACRVVRRGGEVVLVGLPWQRRTDLSAQALLHEVFHRYVVLRTGWEWALPLQGERHAPHSVFGNFAAALQWLATQRVRVEGLYNVAEPRDAQRVYEDLLHQRGRHLTTVFDWAAAR
jgi:threonine dehydrogenase-like Zn-dependent dehydrogenase